MHSGSALPSVPLHNVRLNVSTPVLRSDAPGWHECYLVQTQTVPTWSNLDFFFGRLGLLDLRQPATLLNVTAVDDGGQWNEIAILRIVNGRLESREILDGTSFQDNAHIYIDEASEGFPSSERDLPVKWDRELFRRYNVPTVTRDQVQSACRRCAAETKSLRCRHGSTSHEILLELPFCVTVHPSLMSFNRKADCYGSSKPLPA